MQDLKYRLYSGEHKSIGAYDQEKPSSEGTPPRISLGAVEKAGKFAEAATAWRSVAQSDWLPMITPTSGDISDTASIQHEGCPLCRARAARRSRIAR